MKGGLGALKVLPLVGGVMSAVRLLPITNGTYLYKLMVEPNIEWANTPRKYELLYAMFFGANTALQSLVIYPFVHVYQHELCRRDQTPKVGQRVSAP